ncbi:MAG: hypothetical protein ACYC9Q_14375 [Bacillota bacterium]
MDCIFENKASLSYDALRAYARALMADPAYQVRPVIDGIEPRNKSQCKMLQVADACTSACLEAFEPDQFGNPETAYLEEISKLLYRRNGNLFSYGLKLFPDDGTVLSRSRGYQWLGRM